MRGIRHALQHSLATRVILSTVLLSLGVVWLTGSALYSRLADGILSTSLSSSLAESRYTFFNAEYQMLVSRGMSVAERKRVLAEFVVNTSTQGINEERREVIFMKTPSAKSNVNSYEMSSNIIRSTSIPEDLRVKVQKDSKIQYGYAVATYNNGAAVDSLFVGQDRKSVV
jgi:two-component system sensor histidine kinase MtrB